MEKKAYTTYEIAEFCHVTPRTVVQWVNEGKLKAFRTPGNHSRVFHDDFIAFLKTYQMPLPEGFENGLLNRNKRILIVDDDPSMVDSIKRILIREKRFELESATDGFDAGVKFSSFKPDLILLDINMPKLNGFEVCKQIRGSEEGKNCKVIFISGTVDLQEIKKIKEAGVDEYILKPFNREVLVSKIDKVIG